MTAVGKGELLCLLQKGCGNGGLPTGQWGPCFSVGEEEEVNETLFRNAAALLILERHNERCLSKVKGTRGSQGGRLHVDFPPHENKLLKNSRSSLSSLYEM